jgi:hypothetical protein
VIALIIEKCTSNIWSSVRLKISPQFQASWQQIVYIGYGHLKKNDSFSFYLSIAVLPVF